MNGIKQQIKQTAKQTAIKTAKQVAQETEKFLKEGREQVAGVPDRSEGGEKSQQTAKDADLGDKEMSPEEKAKREQKARSLIAAHEAELADMRRAREGERAVKQEEELVSQAQAEEAKNVKPLQEPVSKPKRGKGLFAGVKTRLERMKRKSEVRMPPSG
jgi:hypothetical protein